MMQSMRTKRRHALPVNAEINFTNLVDVAFVLLIIFMITAPIMQGGIELDLPQVDSPPLTTSEAIVVSVTADARIFLDELEVPLQELPDVFRAYVGAQPNRPVSVGGDGGVAYGRIMEVFDVLREAGVSDLNLLTRPVTPPRRGR